MLPHLYNQVINKFFSSRLESVESIIFSGRHINHEEAVKKLYNFYNRIFQLTLSIYPYENSFDLMRDSFQDISKYNFLSIINLSDLFEQIIYSFKFLLQSYSAMMDKNKLEKLFNYLNTVNTSNSLLISTDRYNDLSFEILSSDRICLMAASTNLVKTFLSRELISLKEYLRSGNPFSIITDSITTEKEIRKILNIIDSSSEMIIEVNEKTKGLNISSKLLLERNSGFNIAYITQAVNSNLCLHSIRFTMLDNPDFFK